MNSANRDQGSSSVTARQPRNSSHTQEKKLADFQDEINDLIDKEQTRYYELLSYRDFLQPMFEWAVADARYIAANSKRYEQLNSEISEMEAQAKQAQQDLENIKQAPRLAHEKELNNAMRILEKAKAELAAANFINRSKARKAVEEAQNLLFHIHNKPLPIPDREELEEAESCAEFFNRYVGDLHAEFNSLERVRKIEAPVPVNSGAIYDRFGHQHTIEGDMSITQAEQLHVTIRGEYNRTLRELEDVKKELLKLKNMTPEKYALSRARSAKHRLHVIDSD